MRKIIFAALLGLSFCFTGCASGINSETTDAAAQQSEKKEYNVGDIAKINKLQLILKSFSVKKINNKNYVVVNAELINTDDSEYEYNFTQFGLEDSTGNIMSPDTLDDGKRYIESGRLENNHSAKGNVAFKTDFDSDMFLHFRDHDDEVLFKLPYDSISH